VSKNNKKEPGTKRAGSKYRHPETGEVLTRRQWQALRNVEKRKLRERVLAAKTPQECQDLANQALLSDSQGGFTFQEVREEALRRKEHLSILASVQIPTSSISSSETEEENEEEEDYFSHLGYMIPDPKSLKLRLGRNQKLFRPARGGGLEEVG